MKLSIKKQLGLFLAIVLLIGGISGCSEDPVEPVTDGEQVEDKNETTKSEEKANEVDEVILLIDESLPSLYEFYQDYFTVGVAVPMKAFQDDNTKALISKHFNSITAENSMKPEAMMNSGQKGEPQFITADLYTAYSDTLGVGLRGHTLVWHQQTPSWFYREGYGDTAPFATKEEMYIRMENHIKGIMERYEGSAIYCWDVVNEVIEPAEENGWRDSAWYQICGPEFVEKSFEYARKHTEGQDIKLFYNDYNVVSDENKRQLIFEMLKPLAEKGLVDGIGLQGHISIGGPSVEAFEETIELFGSIGLEVQITELDISMYTDLETFYSEPPEALLIKQAHQYKEIFDLCVKHSDIVSNVTVWGMTDNTSWLNEFPITRSNFPLLFDKNYQAKPALLGLIGEELPEIPSMPVNKEVEREETEASVASIIIDGEIDGAWDNAPIVEVNTYTQNTLGASGVTKTLHDDEYLYVLIVVEDGNLSAVNGNAWEQDSVEIFIDENLGRSTSYESDDIQYRINYKNEVSINGTVVDGFMSAVTLTDAGYLVEVAIPFQLGSKEMDQAIGFDIQINDDQGSGSRDSMTNWSDLSGKGWSSTSEYGTLIFK